MTTTRPPELPYTGDPQADALLAADPMALLIGFVLDQQVTVQKAFSGPWELRRRIGSLDAATIAGMEPGELEAAFRQRPALHRFPGTMARRTQALCAAIAQTYAGQAERLWSEAADGRDLEARLRALPGIGETKARALLAILARRFGVRLDGLAALVPDEPTLADVDSAESLAAYQQQKRAAKQLRKGGPQGPAPGTGRQPAP